MASKPLRPKKQTVILSDTITHRWSKDQWESIQLEEPEMCKKENKNNEK